jgi:acetyl-CoA carboxylase biotin carboxyl carrier protein
MTSVQFDPDTVRQLALILSETGLTEIEVEGKEGRIRVVRAHPPAQQLLQASVAPQYAPQPLAAAAASGGSTPLAAVPALPADDAHHPGAVLSPMVGIAYLASEPGAAPFVTPGQAVTPGQTLLLIEAMKTFNQIKAPKAGIVARILVAPGAPVEYGQPLLILE